MDKVKKTSVIFIIFCNIITLGFYTPYWFFTRRAQINRLRPRNINMLCSSDELGKDIFIFLTAAYFLSTAAYFLSTVSTIFYDTNEVMEALWFVSLCAVHLTLFMQCFKIRDIFISHFARNPEESKRFSALATLLFGILYLQYKINKFK